MSSTHTSLAALPRLSGPSHDSARESGARLPLPPASDRSARFEDMLPEQRGDDPRRSTEEARKEESAISPESEQAANASREEVAVEQPAAPEGESAGQPEGKKASEEPRNGGDEAAVVAGQAQEKPDLPKSRPSRAPATEDSAAKPGRLPFSIPGVLPQVHGGKWDGVSFPGSGTAPALRSIDLMALRNILPDHTAARALEALEAPASVLARKPALQVTAEGPRVEAFAQRTLEKDTRSEPRGERPGSVQPAMVRSPEAAQSLAQRPAEAVVQAQSVSELPALVLRQLERMRRLGKSWMRMTLRMPDGQPLGLRLEVRQQRVQITFMTASPQLRDALAGQWSNLAEKASRGGFRLDDPLFTHSGS